MSLFMPAPGIIGGGAGAPPEFVNASAALYSTTATSGTNLPAAAAPVAGNLAITFLGQFRTSSWHQAFLDMSVGGGTFPYDKSYISQGGVAPQPAFTSNSYDQMQMRVLTGSDAGANLSWTAIGALVHNFGQTLQFSGCRDAMPFIDGQVRARDTSSYQALGSRWRYNPLTRSTIDAPAIKVSGSKRLAVCAVIIIGTGRTRTITPPAGWTLRATRNSSAGTAAGGKYEIYTKEIDADLAEESWGISSTYQYWGLWNFALLPAGADGLTHMNFRNDPDDLPWGGTAITATHGSTSPNSSGIQQEIASTNRKAYWEMEVVYYGSTNYQRVGMVLNDTGGAAGPARQLGDFANSLAWADGNLTSTNGCTLANAPSGGYITGSRVMFAYDRDAGHLWVGKDGTWDRDPLTLSANWTGLSDAWKPAVGHYHYNGFCRFHPMDFLHGPPTGYKGVLEA